MVITPPASSDPIIEAAVHTFIDNYDWDAVAAPLTELITPAVVRGIIRRSKPFKASGEDGILNFTLKQLSKKGLVMSTYIINACIRLCFFPTPWKQANIIPLPKPGKRKSDPAAHRPIALLSALLKVLEVVMHSKYWFHTNRLNILPAEQHGFRPGHGAPGQLVRVLSRVIQRLDWRRPQYTLMISLDPTKAFDTIWHDALIYKMYHWGYPPFLLKFTRSYLSNRTMRLHTHEIVSLVHDITDGVPQGSIVGPHLYIVFTADMPMPPEALSAVYADDTLRCITHRKPTQCRFVAQRVANTTTNYYDIWRLIVNPQKKQIAAMNASGRLPPQNVQPIEIKGIPVPCGRTIRYLGVDLDISLRLHLHIKAVTTKCMNTFYNLSCLVGRKSSLDPAVKLLLFKVPLRPILVYAAPVWAALISSTSWNKLQICQNKIIKAALSATWSYNTYQAHEETNMEYLHDYILELTQKFYEHVSEWNHEFLLPYITGRRRMPPFFHNPRPPEEEEKDVDDPA